MMMNPSENNDQKFKNIRFETFRHDGAWRWRVTDGLWIWAKSEIYFSSENDVLEDIRELRQGIKDGRHNVFYAGKPNTDTWNYVTIDKNVAAYVTMPIHPCVYEHTSRFHKEDIEKVIVDLFLQAFIPEEWLKELSTPVQGENKA